LNFIYVILFFHSHQFESTFELVSYLKAKFTSAYRCLYVVYIILVFHTSLNLECFAL